MNEKLLVRIACCAAALALAPAGCRQGAQSGPPAPRATAGAAVMPSATALFRDVAAARGISFVHANGATGEFLPIEITPGGCAFLDFDGDGYLDVLLVQSGSSEPFSKVANRQRCALYHNNGDGTFTDVTAGSGFDTDLGYLQGVAVGDYDNDGFADVLLTGYGGNHLFHNRRGTGKFQDVTRAMGLDNIKGYSTSAAFGDYDSDGRLDLYVCSYVSWSWDTNRPCKEGSIVDYCSPESYLAEADHLYHNEGSRFTDVSAKSGISKVKGRGLAVAFVDFDEDGRQDIFVANDLNPNILWHNNGDGTFTDVAAEKGCAFDDSGMVMSGMGIGLADYDHSGRESIFVTNFSNRPNMLYKNVSGSFQDESYPSGLALAHLQFLSFGCDFIDYDADGWPDLMTVNGHVQVHVDRMAAGLTYAERKQLFHNDGHGTFSEVTDAERLGDLSLPTVGRGMAVGDFDNDGRLDVLASSQNSPAQLFRNLDTSPNHWVEFETVGTKSNREGRHAKITVTAGGVRQVGTVRAGSSYLSHSDRRVYFGLGKAARIDRIEIHWPSGTKDTLSQIPSDCIYVVTEGRGITGKRSPSRSRK